MVEQAGGAADELDVDDDVDDDEADLPDLDGAPDVEPIDVAAHSEEDRELEP